MINSNLPGERLCVCLFSFKSANRHEYKRLLGNFNVRVIDIEKEEHFNVFLESVSFNGILIDIPTYIKSSMESKEFLSDISEIYPAARISYNKKADDMDLIVSGEMHKVSLHEFLDRCGSFTARKLRRYKRIPSCLNIRLAFEHDGEPTELLCTSTNISEDGMFVVTFTNNMPVGTDVKIQVLELNKNGSLRGTVMRSLKWGEKPFQAPGFGVRISGAEKEVFADYMKLIEK